MSGFHSSAPLTAALLANKGAAAPSRSVSSLLSSFAEEELAATHPVQAPRAKAEATAAAARPVDQARQAARASGSGGAPRKAATVPAKDRIKLSLRLTEEEHLRLKLAAAHMRESSQTILMMALEDYLKRLAPDVRSGDCACLMSAADGRRSPMPAHGEPYGNAD
jgi:hypothetical protein